MRKYIAQRAELLGAIRLPDNTFSKNAGTQITFDILFLQKRERVIDIEPDWIHLNEDENGLAVNSYFAEHPEMLIIRNIGRNFIDCFRKHFFKICSINLLAGTLHTVR